MRNVMAEADRMRKAAESRRRYCALLLHVARAHGVRGCSREHAGGQVRAAVGIDFVDASCCVEGVSEEAERDASSEATDTATVTSAGAGAEGRADAELSAIADGFAGIAADADRIVLYGLRTSMGVMPSAIVRGRDVAALRLGLFS